VWFGGALPSEAQWEYAARMTSPGTIDNGNLKYAGSNTLNDVAWSGANSGSVDHEVGTLLPTGIGLYDMSGNAWERCLDWCNTTSYSYGDGMAYNNTASNWNKGDGSGDGATADNPFIDPVYNTDFTSRTVRGGSWGNNGAASFLLGYRNGNYAPTYLGNTVSFRVAVVTDELTQF
jgi:formylglycine-generating enzyme required for sulfatase activity